MNEKERRVAMLNHDLRDGKIKLEDDHEFQREYLGEWKDDRVAAMVYAATATVAHRCALCSEVLSREDVRPTVAERMFADHHAVCPKRPIEVGDFVRWEYGDTGHCAMPSNWVEGEVTRIDRYTATIRADRCGMGTRSGKVNEFGIGPDVRSTIRRIPRPAEAQAIELDCYVEWKPDVSRSRAAGQVVKMDGDMAIVRIREVSQTWTAFEACPFSGHARSIPVAQLQRIPWPHEPPVCAPGCQCGAHGERTPGYAPAHVVQQAPGIVDGLDPEALLARWMENRLAVEGGAAPPHAMARMQRDVGRAMWLQRFGAARSAELSAKVAAGREAERNRVRVEVQDVD